MTDSSGPKPTVPYWHLWTDGAGVSHQKQSLLWRGLLRSARFLICR